MGTPERVIQVQQSGTEMQVRFKLPSYGYCESVMRANCFPELWALFKRCHAPLKEISESYAALTKLRKTLLSRTNEDGTLKTWKVYHVGDGAHARTAALFAFMAPNTLNIAIDPQTNEKVLSEWVYAHQVRRFHWHKSRVEDLEFGKDHLPIAVTFVHAHVNVDEVLDNIPGWVVAYSSACCYPDQQRTKKYKILDQGADWRILSEKRDYQVIENLPSTQQEK